MHIELLDDSTYATTPVYAGPEAGMKKMATCTHEWADVGESTDTPYGDPLRIQFQQCGKCGGARSRMLGPSEDWQAVLEGRSG